MRTFKVLSIGVCLLALAATAYHIVCSVRPPGWDDGWYLEMSFRFFQSLCQGPFEFMEEYASSYRIKPPLISVLPLPVYAVAGMGERQALVVHWVSFALTLWLVYRIGKELFGEAAGWAAAMSTACIPILYGLSRLYFVECPLTCLVAAFQLAILRARTGGERPGRGWAGRRMGICLGTMIGLGVLLKSIFPLYVIGTVWLLRKDLLRHARVAAVTAGLVASTWYLFNAPYMLGWTWSTAFGSIARHYGSASPFSPQVLSAYVMRIGYDVFSWGYVICAAILLVWAAWVGGKKSWKPGFGGRFLLWWLLVPAAVLSSGVNKEIRYLAPALPAAALMVGEAAAKAARGRLSVILVSLLLLVPVPLLLTQSFGWPAGPARAFNGPPSDDPGWNRSGVVDELARIRERYPELMVVAVGVEHPLFNANNLASLSASRGLPLRYISLGYAQQSREGALIRLRDKGAKLMVTVQGASQEELPGFLNRANAGIQEWLDLGVIRNKPLAEIPVSPGVLARIYRIWPER